MAIQTIRESLFFYTNSSLSYIDTILVRTNLDAFFVPSILKSFIIKDNVWCIFFSYESIEKNITKKKGKELRTCERLSKEYLCYVHMHLQPPKWSACTSYAISHLIWLNNTFRDLISLNATLLILNNYFYIYMYIIHLITHYDIHGYKPFLKCFSTHKS